VRASEEEDMQKPTGLILTLALGAARASADVWDLSIPPDDQLIGTGNLLVHGGRQVHDLGVRPGPVADEDWYAVYSVPYSSYEFLEDSSTGGVAFSPLTVERTDLGGALLQTGIHLGGLVTPADAVTMSWENATDTLQFDFVRVANASCGTSCTSDDQYTARFYNTTYSIPRFNNAGSQVTVLIIQNAETDLTPVAVVGHAYFWDLSGALVATHPFGVPARSALVVNTATIPGAAGAAGAITISHTGRYGQLSGKAVALEPATGFSFDTPMVPKPY
jgi:hypothetical protein